jgi:hypothetical protein
MFSYLTYVLMQDVDVMKNVPEVMQYYQENGGSLVVMYYDRIIAYFIEQCQESVSSLEESLAPDEEKNAIRQAYSELIDALELLQGE